jgi:hypothetical protein
MENSIPKDLAIKTYNKIFIENLHILTKDFASTKALIIRNQNLLSDKLQKLLFLIELADLIKVNKIDVIKAQVEKYGTVIMANYEEIKELFDWVEEQSEIDTSKKEIKKWWLGEQSSLENLADFLVQEKLINTPQREHFINLFLGNGGERINWMGNKTLLIYLIEQLKAQQVIDSNTPNIFIEHNFSANAKMIENIKQTKSNIKNNKLGKPQQSEVIDAFINTLKNTLPFQKSR